MREDSRLSDDPTDRLIRELVQTGRPVEQSEIQRILHRMATAPFNPRPAPANPDEQGLHYHGRIVEYRNDSLFVHLVRRVVVDEQWAFGVTEVDYLDDLRRAILAPSAKLAIFRRRGGNMAASMTPTDDVVPTFRRGAKSRSRLWVVYSADHGIIVSGYQVARQDEVSIPKDTRWLP